MARVVIAGVTKVFQGPKREAIRAVDQVSLTVEDKELLVLVGPSGCGKTTLLRLIAGLEELTEGTISMDGQVINDVPPKDRDIAMVFQTYALYPHMTAYENMAFGLKLRNCPKAEIAKRVTEAAEMLDLTDCLDRPPSELSGGQRQRVGVGRAIVRKPRLFLLDEPLSNLDPQMRVQTRAGLARLHQRLAATMLYVTHDQVEAMIMGDRIAVMNKSVIQQIAEPMDLYERPANVFVAGFIGSPSMNLISGSLVKSGKELFFQQQAANGHAGQIKLRLEPGTSAGMTDYIGKNVILGIRPEHVEHSIHVPTSPREWTFEGKVEIVEPTGSETHVYIACGRHSIVARVPGADRITVHQKISVVMDMRRALFFDADCLNSVFPLAVQTFADELRQFANRVRLG
jgi:multiple sugar transport system ATP-binding protein